MFLDVTPPAVPLCPPMTRQGTFPLYDALLNGRLRVILRQYQNDEGFGARRIAERLEKDHGVSVSYRTVSRWLKDELEEAA